MGKTRVLPVIFTVAACFVALRALLGSQSDAFSAPQLRSRAAAQTVHQHCRPVKGGSAKLAGGSMPAVVNGVPERRGVAAHFKVTLETPYGTEEFECEDVYILDQAE